MSALLMRRNQAPCADDNWQDATAEEKARAGYFGYFGSYSLDEDEPKVVHRIEGS